MKNECGACADPKPDDGFRACPSCRAKWREAKAPKGDLVKVTPGTIVHLPEGHKSSPYDCRMAMIRWDEFERLIEFKGQMNAPERECELLMDPEADGR